MTGHDPIRVARLVDRATPVIVHRLATLHEQHDHRTIANRRDDITEVTWWDADYVTDTVTLGGSRHYTTLTRQTWGIRTRGGYAVGALTPPMFLVVPERHHTNLARSRSGWRVVVHAFTRYITADDNADLLTLTGRWSLYGVTRVDSEHHDTNLDADPVDGRGSAAAARRLAWATANALAAAIDATAAAWPIP